MRKMVQARLTLLGRNPAMNMTNCYNTSPLSLRVWWQKYAKTRKSDKHCNSSSNKEKKIHRQTEAALASSLHSFRRYSGLSSLGKRPRIVGTRSIGIQPTAIARRRMACGGKRSLQTGRPTTYAAKKEHGYTLLKKKKSVSSGQHLPTHHQLAPHNLEECVSRNVTLGKTHCRK